MDDMSIAIGVALSVVGLVFGSFALASVWRLRLRQLTHDRMAGEKLDKTAQKEVSKLSAKGVVADRSVCLHCGHQLAWYDLIPLLSWLQLRGKCRYCRRAIGWLEPVVEIAVATFFGLSYFFWPVPLDQPLEVVQFMLWLTGGVGLTILTVYDAKWFLLPNSIVFPLIGVAFTYSLLAVIQANFDSAVIMSIVYACMILSGLYYVLYVFSRHTWVGFGDVKLGLALALFLVDWRLAAVALFLANLIGSLVVLPLLAFGRMRRRTLVPFGPLLVAGWVIAGLFGYPLLEWYLSFSVGA